MSEKYMENVQLYLLNDWLVSILIFILSQS